MYGKIFDSIYDGTLAEDWRALVTFQQMIVLCDADGMVDMTPQAMSRRTGIPIEHLIAGIEVLEKSDKYSRTPDENGKRIELIDSHRPWGWHIINHEKYKNTRDADTIREQTRERVRRHREKKKSNAIVTPVTQGNAQKRHIDTDINTNKKDQTLLSPAAPPTCKHKEILEIYHEILPELPRVMPQMYSGSAKEKNLKARWKENEAHQDLEFWRAYFGLVRKNAWWMGDNDRGWKANFEFITKRKNFDNAVEKG